MTQRPEDFQSRIQATEDFLHAAGHGRMEPMARAMAAGANINARRSDQGALLMVVSGRHFDCAKVLLEAGIDPNVKNRTWWTPLHEAGSKDFAEFIAPLAAAGANLNAQDANGTTPLHAAVRNKSPAAAAALLEAGADPGVLDYDGATPLMLAVSTEDPALLEALIVRGANPCATDRDGRTPAQMAQESGWALGASMLTQAQKAASRSTTVEFQPSADQAQPDPAAPANPTPTLTKIGKRRAG